MIWGCQWDRTLEWIVQTNGNDWSLVNDSSSWGNYFNQTFEYTENGTTKMKAAGTAVVIPTGITERNKKNNIYDMAGNVWDWTIEVDYTNGRVVRGGDYKHSGSAGTPASNRNYGSPTSASSVYGSRLAIYLTL